MSAMPHQPETSWVAGRKRPACTWRRLRCYVPSLFALAMTAVLIAYATFVMQGEDLERIMPRHYVNGVLLWFFFAPVILGIMRGTRRSLRHLTRAGRRA